MKLIVTTPGASREILKFFNVWNETNIMHHLSKFAPVPSSFSLEGSSQRNLRDLRSVCPASIGGAEQNVTVEDTLQTSNLVSENL